MNRLLKSSLALLVGLFLSVSVFAQAPYASWENSATGWTNQTSGAYTLSYSTTKGVTAGTYSLACTTASNPGWKNLLSNSDTALKTALASATSVKLDVYPESGSATSVSVTFAVNGEGDGWTWRQSDSYTLTPNTANAVTINLSAAMINAATKSGGFNFWIIVSADAPITFYLDNLRFASNATPPAITTHPVSQTVGAGGSVTFSVSATSSAALTYKWFANGLEVSGATTNTLTIPCLQPSDAGEYYCVASNGGGVATSNVATLTVGAAVATDTASVSIQAGNVVNTVDDKLFGLNTAIWDNSFNGSDTLPLLKAIDMKTLRYPGGSGSDDYDWKTNKSKSSGTTWALDFDHFAAVAVPLGAQVYITANYGSGTAAEAAEWVTYSNITKKYGFKYWEVGNENYGSWETDTHAAKWDPITYANEFKNFMLAMKAVDPTIKVGAVVQLGEDALDAKSPSGQLVTNPRTSVQHKGWTPVVLATLKSLGVKPDYIIYHRYEQSPAYENDAVLLQKASSWKDDATSLRQMLTDYLGAGSESVELHVTENNSVYGDPGKQMCSLVNALYLADSLGNLLQTEFKAMLWWDLRNGQDTTKNNSSSLYGWRLYGDYGLMSGTNDCYPTYYVYKLLSHFTRGGDSVVKVTSSNTLLSTYAVKRVDGTLSLLVINKSPTATTTASFAITGFSPAAIAPIQTYGVAQDRAAQLGSSYRNPVVGTLNSVSANFSTSFLPYSVSVITLYPTGVSSRLANVSVRAVSGISDQVLIPGFVVGGSGTSGTLPVLLRAGGPSLIPFGVPSASVLADPTILAHSAVGSVVTELGSNDNWGGATETVNLFSRLGAYSYGSSTLDSALSITASAGPSYSYYTKGKNNGTGVVLAEVYDASETTTATTPRLINVSGRAQVGTGANELIVGFVIKGTGPKTVLIRGVGPTLGNLGVSGVLATPKLDLHLTRFDQDEIVATNAAWGGTAQLKAAGTKVGAFAMTNDLTKDTALLVTLPPGNYTAVVKGVGDTTGVALVEVYEVE